MFIYIDHRDKYLSLVKDLLLGQEEDQDHLLLAMMLLLSVHLSHKDSKQLLPKLLLHQQLLQNLPHHLQVLAMDFFFLLLMLVTINQVPTKLHLTMDLLPENPRSHLHQLQDHLHNLHKAQGHLHSLLKALGHLHRLHQLPGPLLQTNHRMHQEDPGQQIQILQIRHA